MAVLFDSSLYIGAMRHGGDASLLLTRWAGSEPVWFSSVVLHELYVGSDRGGQKVVARMEDGFKSAGRILVPELSDWAKAGRILARMGLKYGYERIGRARLTNDALIAVSAARVGIMVVTGNKRDFEQLSEFCPLRWQHRSDFNP